MCLSNHEHTTRPSTSSGRAAALNRRTPSHRVSPSIARAEPFSLALSLSKGELTQDVLVEPRAHYSSFDKLRTSGCTQPSNALAQGELVDRSCRALLARPEPVEGRADPGCARRTTSTQLVLRQ